jgi:hypothetical protein
VADVDLMYGILSAMRAMMFGPGFESLPGIQTGLLT